MKKYVACRIIDTTPKPSADTESPKSIAVRDNRPVAPQPGCSAESEPSEPAPVFMAFYALIDRAYCAVPRPVGRRLDFVA